MTGSIMQLICNEDINYKNETCNIIQNYFVNNKIIIERCADAFNIDYIIIENINFDLDDIINIEFNMGSVTIKIPFKFIYKNNTQYNENFIKIKFPYSKIISKYSPLISVQYQKFSLVLETKNNIEIANIKIISKIIYMDTGERRMYALNNIIFPIKNFYEICNTVDYKYKSYGLYFDLQEDCESLKIQLDDIYEFDYDKFTMEPYIEKIDGFKSFYLPFNDNKNLNKFDLTNVIDFRKINNIDISVNNSHVINGKIYNVAHNYVTTDTGRLLEACEFFDYYEFDNKNFNKLDTKYQILNYSQNGITFNNLQINKNVTFNKKCMLSNSRIGNEYTICNDCDSHFNKNVIVDWFDNNAYKCPICGNDWTFNDNTYLNT